ncbi:MAG: hypothetical protein R2845_12500 [Thermomicrobiales bacterium]
MARNPATANVRMAELRSPYGVTLAANETPVENKRDELNFAPEAHSAPSEDALAYIDRVLGNDRGNPGRFSRCVADAARHDLAASADRLER